MRLIQRTLLARKLMLVVIAVCAFFVFTPTAFAAEGDTGSDGDLTWTELADGTVEVTGYTGTGGTVSILPQHLAVRLLRQLVTRHLKVAAHLRALPYQQALRRLKLPHSKIA